MTKPILSSSFRTLTRRAALDDQAIRRMHQPAIQDRRGGVEVNGIDAAIERLNFARREILETHDTDP